MSRPTTTTRWRLARLAAITGAVLAVGSLSSGLSGAEPPDGARKASAEEAAESERECLDELDVAYARARGEGSGPDAFVPPPDATDEQRRAFTVGVETCGIGATDDPTPDDRELDRQMEDLSLETFIRCLEEAGITVEVVELQPGVHQINTPGIDLRSDEHRAIDIRCSERATAIEIATRAKLGG